MQNNNLFSSKRFLMLIRQSLITNKKLIGISLAGLTGTLFVILLFLQSITNFRGWDNQSNMNLFIVLFIFLGMIYSSMSFPAFRSKEKSIVYLLLPASSIEKFVFEILIRIVMFVLLIPFIFWSVSNIEGAIVHHYVPRLTGYYFSFGTGITELMNKGNLGAWGIYAIVQFLLFILISNFAGASHFIKSPLVKTLFTISGVICGYFFLGYLLFTGLSLKEYNPANTGTLFPKNNEEFITIMALGITVVNLALIAVAWFSFKEKEA